MPDDGGAVSVGTGIDQQRVAITGRPRYERRCRSATATGMILDHYGPSPARRKRFGEQSRDHVRAATDAKGLDYGGRYAVRSSQDDQGCTLNAYIESVPLARVATRCRPPMMATSQLRVIPWGPLAPYADVDESARQEVIVAWPVDECRRLRKAEGPSLHLRKGESGLAELVELGKISAGLDDVDLGVCTDVCEAELVNLAEQRPALGEGQAREGGLGGLGRGGPYRVGVADPHAEVWFLEHQPPAGSQPGDYPSQQVHARGICA